MNILAGWDTTIIERTGVLTRSDLESCKMMFRSSFLTLATLGILFTLTPNLQAEESTLPFYLHDGDVVVFYGDSITEQRQYSSMVEAFVVTRFPTLKVSYINSGVGGDTVKGGGAGPIDTRIQRDILAYKPTVVTIMLGMNDGGRRAYDEGLFQTFSQGYLYILDQVSKAIPGTRFTLLEESPFDEITRPPEFPGGYNATMLRYGEFVKKTAEDRKEAFADFNHSVNAMLTKANAMDSKVAQQMLPDRVHPNPGGHLIMAETLLKAWNAPGLVSQVEIDAKNNKVVTANQTTVSELQTAGTISWQQLDNRLPFPMDPNDPGTLALALKCSDFVDALDQETLKVTGLGKESYRLKIDGTDLGNFTSAQLDAGVNLATLHTPMFMQAAQVANLTYLHHDKHFMRWRQLQVPLEADTDPELKTALPVVLRAFDRQEEAIVAQQREAAQPKPHKYELTESTTNP